MKLHCTLYFVKYLYKYFGMILKTKFSFLLLNIEAFYKQNTEIFSQI
jgi:hypothetical protein